MEGKAGTVAKKARTPHRPKRRMRRQVEPRGNARLDLAAIEIAMQRLGYGPADLARHVVGQGYDGTTGSTERSIRYVLSGQTERPTYTLADHIARALGVQLELVTLRE